MDEPLTADAVRRIVREELRAVVDALVTGWQDQRWREETRRRMDERRQAAAQREAAG